MIKHVKEIQPTQLTLRVTYQEGRLMVARAQCLNAHWDFVQSLMHTQEATRR